MNRRVYVWCIVFLAAVALALAGCAQKEPVEGEPAQVQEQETEKTKQKEPEVEAEEERESKTAEEEEVEEYGVEQEEGKKAQKEAQKEAEEEKLSSDAKKTLKERIHFAFDSSVLSQEAQDALKSKAKILKKNRELRLVIEGHCDERGTDEYNMALGERRARAAYEYLILLGVDADRMDLVSYGEERPLVEDSNEEAWAKNRRDEFRIKR